MQETRTSFVLLSGGGSDGGNGGDHGGGGGGGGHRQHVSNASAESLLTRTVDAAAGKKKRMNALDHQLHSFRWWKVSSAERQRTVKDVRPKESVATACE